MTILYEDNHLIIIDKPSGLPSQGDSTTDDCAIDLVKNYIKQEYNKPGNVYTGLVHRLDRPTSGCLMLCKTSKALSRMSEQFKKRKVEKSYLAVVDRPVPDSHMHLENYLFKNKKINQSRVVNAQHQGAKHAVLDAEVVLSIKGHSLLRITPLTGRAHQIRVQLAHIGIPIVGDVKYGGRRHNEPRAICLHSHMLAFHHPVTKEELVIKSLPSQHHWLKYEQLLAQVNS